MVKSKLRAGAKLPIQDIFKIAAQFDDLEEEVAQLKLAKERNIFERFSFPPTMVPKKIPSEPEEESKCDYCRTCTRKKGCRCCECDAHTGGKNCECSCCESERQCKAYQDHFYDRDY